MRKFEKNVLISSYFRLFTWLSLITLFTGVTIAQFTPSQLLDFLLEWNLYFFFLAAIGYAISGIFAKCPCCGCRVMFEAGKSSYPKKMKLDHASSIVFKSIFSRWFSCIKCGSTYKI